MTITSNSGVKPKPLLLIVKNSNEDFEVLQQFIVQSPIEMHTHCVSGDKALACLYQTDISSNQENLPLPGLIILDLNLLGTDGRDVLRRIKIIKPINFSQLKRNIQTLLDCWLEVTTLPNYQEI